MAGENGNENEGLIPRAFRNIFETIDTTREGYIETEGYIDTMRDILIRHVRDILIDTTRKGYIN
jgi:hypothetical protein